MRCGASWCRGSVPVRAGSIRPYGGFGLNNGLEDAVNLGWKLAAKLDGWGGEALLQSYSEERRPIFQEVAEDFIAARIRMQGYACKHAQSAEHLRQASRPNEAVWMLRCDNATYRVRLVPDMAATVELIK